MEFKDNKNYSQNYQDGKYGRPDPSTPVEERSEKFFLDWCEFAYGGFCYGSTYIQNGGFIRMGTSGPRTIFEQRAYARGSQDVNKYKGWVDVVVDAVNPHTQSQNPTMTKASIMNMSWDNVQVLPKFRDVALSKILTPQYEPVVRATDTLSNSERRKKYLADKLATDERMKRLFAATGIRPDGVNIDYESMDAGDVEVLQNLGAYALPTEILMQDVIGASLDMTGFEELNRQLAEDEYDTGIMAAQIQALPGQGRIGLKYVDPAGLIVPMSAYSDGRDMPYAGYVEHIPISQLRDETGLPEKEIWKIAKQYKSYAPNVAMSRNFRDNINDLEWRQQFAQQNNYQVYDNFTVCVMNLWFICHDTENYIIGTRENGSAIYDKVGAEAKLNSSNKKQGKEIVPSDPIQYVYKCRWVVGTNTVFDYGLDDTIVRVGAVGSKRAVLPILTWRSNAPSVIERAISIVDDLQLAFLKLRALLANLPPGPRYSIDVSALEPAVRLGRQDFSPLETLKIYAGKGVLFYASKSEFANPDFGASNKNPITPMPSGAQEDFNLFSGVIAQSMEMLRQVTGINEVADGSANPQDALVGTVQNLEAASNNSLKPHMAAMATMYKNIVGTMAKKYQSLAVHGTIEMKYWPMDANIVKTLELNPDIALYDLEVDARIMPSERDIQIIEQQMLEGQAQGKITPADALIVSDMIRDKDVKKARVYMARAIAKNEQRMQQQKMQEMQMQTQGNIASAQAAEKAKMDTIGLQGDITGKLNEQLHQFKIKEMQEESRLRREEMALGGAVETAKEKVLQETD